MKKYLKPEISYWFDNLAEELFWAKVHLRHADALVLTWKKYKHRIKEPTPVWRDAQLAHTAAALMRLCRVYDETGLNIEQLLLAVKHHPDWLDRSGDRERMSKHPFFKPAVHKIKDIDPRRLDADMHLVAPSSPLVRKLLMWRNKRLFHKTPEDIWKREDFSSRHPLLLRDLEALLKLGYKILNHYSWYTRGIRSWDDIDLMPDYDRIFGAMAENERQRKKRQNEEGKQ